MRVGMMTVETCEHSAIDRGHQVRTWAIVALAVAFLLALGWQAYSNRVASETKARVDKLEPRVSRVEVRVDVETRRQVAQNERDLTALAAVVARLQRVERAAGVRVQPGQTAAVRGHRTPSAATRGTHPTRSTPANGPVMPVPATSAGPVPVAPPAAAAPPVARDPADELDSVFEPITRLLGGAL